MMRSVLASLLFLMSMYAYGASPKPLEPMTMTVENHFAIRGAFTEKLADNFIMKLASFDGGTFIIHINSPGGLIYAGKRMISAMKGRPDVKFVCVAEYAASMGFNLLQYCDVRVAVEHTDLMAHNGSGGFNDELPRLKTEIAAFESSDKEMHLQAAKRMGISYKAFSDMLKDNIQMDKALAIKARAVDLENNRVSCSSVLMSITLNKVVTIDVDKCAKTTEMFTIVMSACPLIREPLSVLDTKGKPATPEQIEDVKETLAEETACKFKQCKLDMRMLIQQ